MPERTTTSGPTTTSRRPTTSGPTSSRPAPPSRVRRLLVPVLVLVALLGVTAFLLLGGQDGGGDREGSGSAPTAGAGPDDQAGAVDMPAADASEEEIVSALDGLARREEGDPTALGEVDAPVVMIAYSEFQCPFCGRFARETEPVLVEEFVEDGSLRIEWRDFPYLGEESRTAALAGRAAAAQDAFWAFEEAMFENQQPPNSGRVTPDFLADVAEGVGLDRQQFLADLESEEVAAAVDRDFQEGQSIGVTGTPAFLINGRPVMGAQPTDVFVQVVEEALAEAEAGR
ncbi:DsbA family protein [Ornithinimicrobium sp. W1679]|uniref:DsbA family protein n=1 Tax=Ornithinimicrobium sp. W1679 TaxID=3418770 RepID=UPI003CFA1A28